MSGRGTSTTTRTSPAAHPDRPLVRVEASPRLSVSPLRALHVRVWIEPEAANRGFDVSVAGEHFYRSSAEQLAGADAPRVHDVWWDPTFVPCGRYEIAAATFNSVGRVLHEAHDRALICRI